MITLSIENAYEGKPSSWYDNLNTQEEQGLPSICSTFNTLCPFGIYTPALSILFCRHKPWLHIGRWCRWQALNNLTGSKADYNKNSRLRTLAGSEPNRIGWWAPEEIMPSGQAVSPILCCMYEKFSDIIYRISLPCQVGTESAKIILICLV